MSNLWKVRPDHGLEIEPSETAWGKRNGVNSKHPFIAHPDSLKTREDILYFATTVILRERWITKELELEFIKKALSLNAER